MVIIGAGGLATQIMDVIERTHSNEKILFFDNVTSFASTPLKFERPILTSLEDIIIHSQNDSDILVMGLANLAAKKEIVLYVKKNLLSFTTIIAQSVLLGKHNVTIGTGSVILEHCIIESNVSIGEMCLINTSSKIFHDSTIGDFTEIAPNCSILGRCTIGKNVFIGANATLLPDICIGDDAIIGAGSIVTKNVEAGTKVKGNPAKIY